MKVPAAFKDISPNWARKIESAKTVRELQGFAEHPEGCLAPIDHDSDGGNMQDYKACIVGESYGMTDSYMYSNGSKKRCTDCVAFSELFGKILTGRLDTTGNRKKLLQQSINDFTNHHRDTHNPNINIVPETEQQEDLIEVKH